MSSRDKYIYAALASFLLGILVSSFVHLAPIVGAFLIFLSLAIVSAERIWNKKVSAVIWLIAISLASFAFGSIRYAIKDFHEPSTSLEEAVGHGTALTGFVASEPERRDTDTRFVLDSSGEKILVSTDMYAPVAYGDDVTVAGKLLKPGIIASDFGRDFDYASYLAKDDIYYTMSFAKTSFTESPSAALGQASRQSRQMVIRFVKILLNIKNSFINKIRSLISEPESSLLAGLIIAGKDALPKPILDDFQRAGLIHIVVLSGYNITIVAEFLRKVFSYLSLRASASAALGGIIIFILMTGGSASIIRAAILAVIAIGGKLIHREYHIGRALLLVAVVMTLINPKELVFDPSFHLSFLATLGMVYLAPFIERRMMFISYNWLKTLLAVTLGTQAAVVPYITYSMGNISFVSLITNILVLPLVPYTMGLGFVSTLLGYLHPYAALPLAYVSHLMLSWILWVSRVFGSLPWGSAHFAGLPLWMTALSYTGLIIIVLLDRSRLKPASL